MVNIKAVIFDFGYTIYDNEHGYLMDGAIEVIEQLHKKGFKLALVSRTKDVNKRKRQIKELDLGKYFDFIEILPMEGTKEFEPIIKKFGFKPDEFLVVGDRLISEIAQGNISGMKTCRFLYGPEKDRDPQAEHENPDCTIFNLTEILNLV